MSNQEDEIPFVIKKEPEPKETLNLSKYLFLIPLLFVVVVVVAIAFTYVEEVQVKGPIPITDKMSDKSIYEFEVSTTGPFVGDTIAFDRVGMLMTHESPLLSEVQYALMWVDSATEEDLLELESMLIGGAMLNENRISVAERTMLDMISWKLYPESCETVTAFQYCKFFDINYNQKLLADGVIDGETYWNNIKKYADEETIAIVENQRLT